MRRVLVIAGLGIGLVLAAPAAAPGAGGPVPPAQGGAGTSAPGGDVTYVAVGLQGATIVERIRRAGGAVIRSRAVRGSWGVPGVAYDGSSTGLSADGRTLVLAASIRTYPPRRTRLLVFDARRMHARATIALPGFSTVDAISPDGRWLYLLRYPSAGDVLKYEVRAYDLVRRRLLAKPVVDPREPDEKMGGLPMTRTVSADGRWAYTLYQRPGADPFVHALDTQGRTAACIDLPSLGGIEDPSAIRLALAPGGGDGTLRVQRNGTPVALVDTRTFAVRSPPAARRAAAPARRAASPDDGSTLPWILVVVPPLVALAALGFVARRRRAVRSAPV